VGVALATTADAQSFEVLKSGLKPLPQKTQYHLNTAWN